MKRLPILTLLFPGLILSAVFCWKADNWFSAKATASKDEQENQTKNEQAEQNSPQEMTHLLKTVRMRLMNPETPYTVKMLQFARIEDQREVIRGEYSQSGVLKSRLSIEMSFLDVHARLLQISDGERLWTERQMVPQQVDEDDDADPNIVMTPWLEVRRRQLSSLNRIVEERDLSLESPEVCQMMSAGVPAMLASLERMFRWTQKQSTVINQRPAILLEGTWPGQSLLNLEPKSPHQMMMFEHFRPDLAELSLDEQTGLPVRIIYYDQEKHKDADSSKSPVFAIEFQEWQFGQQLPPETFQYQIPNNIVPVDETHECMVHLTP